MAHISHRTLSGAPIGLKPIAILVDLQKGINGEIKTKSYYDTFLKLYRDFKSQVLCMS